MIELMIVLALVGVIAGFAMMFSFSSIARTNSAGERDLLVSLLNQARARALANVNEAAHGVYIDTENERYVAYAKQGGCANATTSTVLIPFQSSSTYAGPLDRCFSQLAVRVAAGQTGTTTISMGTLAYTVSVNTIGRIDW